MLLALLILGVAGHSSLVMAIKYTGSSSRIHRLVSKKTKVPKLMGMLVLGMQAGELANHKEHLSIVIVLAIMFSIAIWIAMKMRSGVGDDMPPERK